MRAPRQAIHLVVGFDAAWGGTGWCIATQRGPELAGHVTPDNSSYRMHRLAAFLLALEGPVADAQLQLHPSDPPPRAVIERLPWRYPGRRGNQIRTVYGISGCAHVIAGHFCRPGWAVPWLVPPQNERPKNSKTTTIGWRPWWSLSGPRAGVKRSACSLVRLHGWGRLLDALPGCAGGDVDADGDGPRGDTAEAILIAVGAARNAAEAPRSPRAWPTHTLTGERP